MEFSEATGSDGHAIIERFWRRFRAMPQESGIPSAAQARTALASRPPLALFAPYKLLYEILLQNSFGCIFEMTE
jgi:hypothetical protein